MEVVKQPICNALDVMCEENRLLCISHGVEVKDIANEIYHLIFGEVNELLVLSGVVATPLSIPGEGRYLKSFER